VRLVLATFLGLVAGTGVYAQATGQNALSDNLFAQWVSAAVPLEDHVQQLRSAGLIKPTDSVEKEGFCAWQPIPNALLLAKHVDCPRLTMAMESN
jgi:hypothetical protein